MLNRLLPRSYRFHCPDEHELAAYVDQQLIGAERERVESHLAKCDSCLQQVGFLVKHVYVPEESAPPWLLHGAKILKTPAHQSVRFGMKSVSVAAASAVLAIGLLVWREARPRTEEHSILIARAPDPSAATIPEKEEPEADTAVRSLSPTDFQILILSPQADAIIRDSDFTIRWKAIPEAAEYEVQIVTADGDLAWRKKVHGNSVIAPKQTLRRGLKYFVWVRASLPNGKTQQSAAVALIGG